MWTKRFQQQAGDAPCDYFAEKCSLLWHPYDERGHVFLHYGPIVSSFDQAQKDIDIGFEYNWCFV